MKRDEYQKAIEVAQAEIQEILRKRAGLDARLAQLKTTVESLSALQQEAPKIETDSAFWNRFGEAFAATAGITDVIRKVLAEAKMPLTPVQIKHGVESAGLDTSNYANAMAVIHNTLARLEKQGEVIKIGDSYSLVRNVFVPRGIAAGFKSVDNLRGTLSKKPGDK